jgi:nitrile hydratase
LKGSILVNGVHDLGGTHGFGRVPVEDAGSFHADWEERVFAIQMQMIARGAPRNLDEARFDVERLEPAFYLAAGYFERWLVANERRLVRRGLLTEEELEERRRRLQADPEAPLPQNTDDEFAARVIDGLRRSRRTSRETTRVRRFGLGDTVLTRNAHPTAHTRLPRYARGRRGTIERLYEAFDLPELAAVGEGRPEHLYAVRFEASELWGDSAEQNTSVCLDLWESYLLPA